MQEEVAVNLSFHPAICLEGLKSTNMSVMITDIRVEV